MNTTRKQIIPNKNTPITSLKREIEKLKEELKDARLNLLFVLPREVEALIVGYKQCHCYIEFVTWRRAVINDIMEIASSTATPSKLGFPPRAMCPLCNDGTQSLYESGFTLPVGLERHLEGFGNNYKCVVMTTIEKLAGENWKQSDLFPYYHTNTKSVVKAELNARRKRENLYRRSPISEPELLSEADTLFTNPRTPDQLAWAEKRLLSMGFSRQIEGNVITWLDERQDWDVYADPRTHGHIQIEVWRRSRRPEPQPSRPVGTFQIPDTFKHDLQGKYATRLAQAVKDQGGLDKRNPGETATNVPLRRPDAPSQA